MEMLSATKMSRSLKALCDVNRIRILEILVHGEFCVPELVEQLAIDQPKVAHHLAILRSAGIIRSRRDGRQINYSIRPTVYSRQDSPTSPLDVFDLGDLTVTFFFGEAIQELQATKMSQSLKALCDVNRIRILEILVHGEFCVPELVEQLAIDQPKVAHHLAILRSAGIIRSRRDGRHINYSIRPTVYSRQDSPTSPLDVFDLGDLTITIRFRETAGVESDFGISFGPDCTADDITFVIEGIKRLFQEVGGVGFKIDIERPRIPVDDQVVKP